MNFREDFCKETGFDIKDLTPQHEMFKYYTYYLEDKLKQQLSINSVRHFKIMKLSICHEKGRIDLDIEIKNLFKPDGILYKDEYIKIAETYIDIDDNRFCLCSDTA